MKKTSLILSVAAMSAALVSCQQEIAPVEPVFNEGSVPFVLNAEIAPKTTINTSTWATSWEDGDIIYAVTTDEAWGKPYADDKTAATIAEFTCADGAFTTDATIADGSHTFNFFYTVPGQKSYHRGASTSVTLSNEQAENASSPTAHLKLHDALAGQISLTTPSSTPVSVTMNPIFTIMKVVLANNSGASQTVTKFEVNFDGADIAGIYNVTFGADPSVSIKSKNSSSITVPVTNGTVADGSELPIYFVMAPLASYSGDVTMKVTTTSDTFTKTNTVASLNFPAGAHNDAVFNMKTADPKNTYVRVTSIADVTPGKYVIVAKTKAKTAYLPNTENTSSAPLIADVVITDDKIDGAATMIWDFAGSVSGMTIKNAAGKYLYNTNNNNGVRVGGTADTWKISAHMSGNAGVFQMQDVSNSRFIGIYNDADWRSYTTANAGNYTTDTGSSEIMLFKYDDGKIASDLAYSATDKTMSLDDEVTGMPVLSGYKAETATFTSSKKTVATVDAAGVVTIVGVGETTISASVPSDATHKAGEASYKLTVTAPVRTFTVSPVSFAGVPATGATGKTVAVTASDKVVWSVIEDSDITITSCTAAASGPNYSGSGVITFDVASNSGVSRSLELLISTTDAYVATDKDVTVTVSQLGSIAAKSFGVTEAGTTIDISKAEYDGAPIHVTGDADVAWTVALKSGTSSAIAFDTNGTGPGSVSVMIEANTGVARKFVLTVSTTDALVPEEARSYDVTISQAAGVQSSSIDFESAASTYTDWTFTNIVSAQSGTISAHGGSKYGTTDGKTTGSIKTASKIAAPQSIKFYVSKQSNNTTASSWYVEVSTDGSSWTKVKTQSASSMSKGSWVEVSQSLTSYTNVYVRISYDGSSAVRNIDDVTLVY